MTNRRGSRVQIGGLARELERKQSYKHFVQYDGQRAAVSCPPDTYLHIRGGWLSTQYGEQLPTPDLTLHFGTDPTGTYGTDGWWAPTAFTNAGYYKSAIVLRSNTWDSTENQLGTAANVIWQSEVSSAECAEEWADYDLRYTLDQYYGYPLCIIVCRNNGITSATSSDRGNILRIDAVNRGNSYLWRDIRPVMYNPYRTTSIGAVPTAPTCT